MNIYQVDVTKTTTYYVAAESRDAAKADADNMQVDNSDFGWDEDTYVYQADARFVPDDELIWSGGPDGDWLTLTELNAEVKKETVVLEGQESLL